jgi:hypothetical protein
VRSIRLFHAVQTLECTATGCQTVKRESGEDAMEPTDDKGVYKKALETGLEKLPIARYRQIDIFFHRVNPPAEQRNECYCELVDGSCKRTLTGDTISEVRAKIDAALIDRKG